MSDRFDGVRRATAADIDRLLLFVPQVLAETTVLPLSSLKIERLVERCACGLGGAIAGIIDGADDTIDASIGLTFTESATSEEPYIIVAWCGLHPGIRKHPGNQTDPKAHYGRRLFEFAKWCHANLEAAARRPILMQFDIATRTFLGPKMSLYQRNLQQIGAMFAFGAAGEFKVQVVEAAA
jgi:hypothetical protein